MIWTGIGLLVLFGVGVYLNQKIRSLVGFKRRRLPDERRAITHHFSVGGQEGYVTVGLYEDGQPGEALVRLVFIEITYKNGRNFDLVTKYHSIFLPCWSRP